jgi:hypothetical protein
VALCIRGRTGARQVDDALDTGSPGGSHESLRAAGVDSLECLAAARRFDWAVAEGQGDHERVGAGEGRAERGGVGDIRRSDLDVVG